VPFGKDKRTLWEASAAEGLDKRVDINTMRMTKNLTPNIIGAACNCLAIRHAARGIARRYDEAFRPLDLHNGQFSMLVVIAGLKAGGI
jgi:hypothetical protein